MQVFHVSTVSAAVRQLFRLAPPRPLTGTMFIHAEAGGFFYNATLHQEEVRFFRSKMLPDGEPGSLGERLGAEPEGVVWNLVSSGPVVKTVAFPG